MTYESSLAVARVIHRCDRTQLDVLDPRSEVLWPDGSAVHLHPCRLHGVQARTVRAYHHAGRWFAFDLNRIAPKIASDLASANLRDHPGLTMYGLRRAYPTAAAFRAAAEAHTLTVIDGAARPATKRPPAAKLPTIVGRADRSFIACTTTEEGDRRAAA